MGHHTAGMKIFMLVGMLIGLLVTMWLVMRDVREKTAGASGTTAIKPIERAVEMRRTLEAADKLKERRLDGAARE
jgi:hypothetical protein